VNGVRITPGTPMPLTGRDVVQLGKFEVRVRSSDIGGSKDITPSARQAAVATMVHTRLSVVTHLVADVRGFTQISQNTDSETVLKLMGGIIDSFTAITHAHRGTIKDYAGDAVYSFWDHGVSAKPEIGVQACRAALAQTEALDGMREELRARGFEGADGLKLGWGITTGQVAMSAYGASSDLAVVGDSTNLAFRLSGMANKDFDAAVALDRETAELVAPHATLDDLGEHAVRGRAGVEHLWSLRKVEP
jgi:class 3 adenylate cyclase